MIRDGSPKQFSIMWKDRGVEPRVKPNPAYPDGVDMVIAKDDEAACRVSLPYPARRCGVYIVDCKLCGYRLAVTTAGRRDDPRSVAIPCKAR